MAGEPWTPELDAQLSTLWATGMAASAIGAKIGRSKNSTVGRVHRLGLPGRPSPLGPKISNAPRKPRRRPRSQPVALTPLASVAQPAPAPSHPPAAAIPLPRARRCQFPLWPFGARPTHAYCDAPSPAGGSWCAAHGRVVFDMRPPREIAA